MNLTMTSLFERLNIQNYIKKFKKYRLRKNLKDAVISRLIKEKEYNDMMFKLIERKIEMIEEDLKEQKKFISINR